MIKLYNIFHKWLTCKHHNKFSFFYIIYLYCSVNDLCNNLWIFINCSLLGVDQVKFTIVFLYRFLFLIVRREAVVDCSSNQYHSIYIVHLLYIVFIFIMSIEYGNKINAHGPKILNVSSWYSAKLCELLINVLLRFYWYSKWVGHNWGHAVIILQTYYAKYNVLVWVINFLIWLIKCSVFFLQ